MSFDDSEIDLAEHETWLASKLSDVNCEIWIGEVDAIPIGQVRFDSSGDGPVVVSIAVAPSARGHGLGHALLRDALGRRAVPGSPVLARIRSENEASLRLFRSCGFAEVDRDGDCVTVAC